MRTSIPAAAAVELWLTAGDVFDELEDGDAGTWQAYGQAITINAGVALLLLSQSAALRLSSRRFDEKIAGRVAGELGRHGGAACSGQNADVAHATRLALSEKEYLEMTGVRSGSLIECACRIGAILASSDERRVAVWGRAGRHLGIYGQLVNDAHSLEAVGQKTDIQQRKKTLPVIYGMEQAEGKERELLESVFAGSAGLSAETMSTTVEVLKRVGAFK